MSIYKCFSNAPSGGNIPREGGDTRADWDRVVPMENEAINDANGNAASRKRSTETRVMGEMSGKSYESPSGALPGRKRRKRQDIVMGQLVNVKEVTQPIQGYDEFEVDIEKVMRAELRPHFESLSAAPLTRESILLIPERAKGAYILHLDGLPVYAGKTDTRHGFRDRLLRHHFTLQHRQNIDIDSITFKAVRVMVFSNFDVEAILIGEMRRFDRKSLPWNDTGFGSNDPGHNREREEPGEFDRANPINIDTPLVGVPLEPGETPLFDAFLKVKDWLPYIFRWETDLKPDRKPAHWKRGHIDYRQTAARITVPSGPITARQFLKEALRVLPDGWRVTVFPGRVILYKEHVSYPYALDHFEKSST